MGASGSGKSTLLSWLSGVLDSAFNTEGEIFLANERVDKLPCEQRKMGLLFQDALLFPHMSVGENLLFGLPKEVHSREQIAQKALKEAGLSEYYNADPDTLSGGEKARVSLLRTLLSEPRALLLDEPYSRLDQSLREQFRKFVLDHIHSRKLPTLIVTHDEDDIPANARVLNIADFQ